MTRQLVATWDSDRGVWETGNVALCGHSEVFTAVWPPSGEQVEGVAYANKNPQTATEELGPLLPTPNPFHMGNTEDPETWRARRLDVFKRTGTRHGPALSVVALSIAQGKPLTPDRYMPDEEE